MLQSHLYEDLDVTLSLLSANFVFPSFDVKNDFEIVQIFYTLVLMNACRQRSMNITVNIYK